MLLLKVLQYPHETPVLESLFKLFFCRSEGLQLYSNVNILKLKRLPISKNIVHCYMGLKFQGLESMKASVSISHPGPAFENVRQMPLLSQLSYYIGYFWLF